MGTALLFLLLLDGIILFPSPTALRLEIAAVVSVVVLVMIAAIWSRNTRLEREARTK